MYELRPESNISKRRNLLLFFLILTITMIPLYTLLIYRASQRAAPPEIIIPQKGELELTIKMAEDFKVYFLNESSGEFVQPESYYPISLNVMYSRINVGDRELNITWEETIKYWNHSTNKVVEVDVVRFPGDYGLFGHETNIVNNSHGPPSENLTRENYSIAGKSLQVLGERNSYFYFTYFHFVLLNGSAELATLWRDGYIKVYSPFKISDSTAIVYNDAFEWEGEINYLILTNSLDILQNLILNRETTVDILEYQRHGFFLNTDPHEIVFKAIKFFAPIGDFGGCEEIPWPSPCDINTTFTVEYELDGFPREVTNSFPFHQLVEWGLP